MPPESDFIRSIRNQDVAFMVDWAKTGGRFDQLVDLTNLITIPGYLREMHKRIKDDAVSAQRAYYDAIKVLDRMEIAFTKDSSSPLNTVEDIQNQIRVTQIAKEKAHKAVDDEFTDVVHFIMTAA